MNPLWTEENSKNIRNVPDRFFPQVYENIPRLRNNLTVLATNTDMNGTEYISMYEGLYIFMRLNKKVE